MRIARPRSQKESDSTSVRHGIPPLAAAVAFLNWTPSDKRRKFALILMLISLPAEAHDWYPKECCEENHCHPVNCAEIRNGGTSSFGVAISCQKLSYLHR